MQKLLSLPPNLIDSFHQLEEVNHTDWFCTSDPVGSKLGSGGGTTWLLQACHQAFAPEETFSKWIGNEKKILLHAGGQSRRLPGYAPSDNLAIDDNLASQKGAETPEQEHKEVTP